MVGTPGDPHSRAVFFEQRAAALVQSNPGVRLDQMPVDLRENIGIPRDPSESLLGIAKDP